MWCAPRKKLLLLGQCGIVSNMSPGKKGSMSAEHKVALAAGRAEGRAVRLYLEALERNKPRRGRRPSTESLQRQLAEISQRLVDADPLQRLQLIQQRKT